MTAAELLDMDPDTFTGDPPDHPVEPGHRWWWMHAAFALIRENDLCGHPNAAAHMAALTKAHGDITGAGDSLLYAWHRIAEAAKV